MNKLLRFIVAVLLVLDLGSGAYAQTAGLAQYPAKVIAGVSVSKNYPGASLDVRVNACITDAETLANGNTSGICDSTGESGTQSILASIIVGNSSNAPVTWKLPSNCNWTASGFASNGALAVITQHAGSDIHGDVNNWTQCIIYDTNAYIGAVYQTVETGYYRAEGFTLYNGGYTVSQGATMVINPTLDNSAWAYIGILHQTAASAAMKIAGAGGTPGSVCCGTTFDHIQANSNNQGGIVLDLEGTSSGEPIAVSFRDSTFTHPKTGQPAILCNDTVTTKSSQVNFYNTYIETGNTDTTTALIQNTGCGQLNFWGLNITDPSTTSTASAITNSNTAATAVNVYGLTQYAGFSQPVAASIVNSLTGETIPTDNYGHISSYHSGPNYFTQITTPGVMTGGVNPQTGTSYTVLASDANKLVRFSNASAVAVTLPVASAAGFGSPNVFHFKNIGAGTVTITPTTSTVDGFTTLTLGPYDGAEVWSDGTNYTTTGRGPLIGSPTPTIAAGTGAGTGPTLALAAGSTNYAGQVQLTAGSSPASSSAIWTITFANGGFKKAPWCTVSPASYNAATPSPFNVNGAGSLTQLAVYSTGALLNGSVYYYQYNCPE